jgi:hypothetical protein
MTRHRHWRQHTPCLPCLARHRSRGGRALPAAGPKASNGTVCVWASASASPRCSAPPCSCLHLAWAISDVVAASLPLRGHTPAAHGVGCWCLSPGQMEHPPRLHWPGTAHLRGAGRNSDQRTGSEVQSRDARSSEWRGLPSWTATGRLQSWKRLGRLSHPARGHKQE